MANEVEIKVNADATKATKEMSKFKTKVQDVTKAVADVAMKMGVVGAAITGFGFYAAKQFADAGDAIDKMSGRTGISNRMLQVFSHAADLAGGSIANVEMAVIGLGKKIPMLEKETTPAGAAFKAMGLNLAEFTAMNNEDRFLAIGDALSKVSDETLRNEHAMNLLGGSGIKLANMFRTDFIEQVKSAEEALDSMGAILDDEAVASAAAYTDALDELGKAKQALIITIGKLITPWLMTLAEKMTGIISIMTLWTNAHPKVTQGIMLIAGGLALLLPLLATAKIAMMGWALATKIFIGLKGGVLAIRTAFMLLNLAVAPWIAVPALLIAGLFLLVKAYKNDWGNIRKIVDFAVNAVLTTLENWVNHMINAFNGVMDIIRPFSGFIEEHLGVKIPDKIDTVAFSFDSLKEKTGRMAESVKGSFGDMTDNLKGFFSVSQSGAVDFEQSMTNIQNNLNGVKKTVETVIDAYENLNDVLMGEAHHGTGRTGKKDPTGPDGPPVVIPERIQKTLKQIYLEGYKKLMSNDMLADDGRNFARNFGQEFAPFTGLDPQPFVRGDEYEKIRKPTEVRLIIEDKSGVDLKFRAEQDQDMQDRIEVDI